MEERLATAIVQVLDGRFGVDALWVFGSEATGRATPTSDLDLAALFRARPTPSERLDLQAEIATLAGRDVDLIDLDAASPVLAMQVLRHGQLIIDRNPHRRIALATLLPSRYEDLRRLRAPIERKIAERMGHGRA